MSEVDFSMLDSSLEDLADLKGFEPIAAGTHKLSITWDKKEINSLPAVILKLKVEDVIELSNPEDTCEPGRTSDIAFILKKKEKDGTVVRNEIAEGQLKEVLKVLHPVFGGATNAETIAASEGATVVATLKIRVDKNDPDKKYNQIKAIALPE